MNNNPYILYIEDERPMLELVRQALKLAGHDVTGVLTGRQGIELMRQSPPGLVLLDLMMPDFNGWDVFSSMKEDEQLSKVPVIVVTAKIPSQGRTVIRGLPPADDYITKPFDGERLIRSVQNLLPAGSSSAPATAA
ncbi:MAG: hypothetical protein Kow0031_22150 [Anaerolineae bacterium]